MPFRVVDGILELRGEGLAGKGAPYQGDGSGARGQCNDTEYGVLIGGVGACIVFGFVIATILIKTPYSVSLH